MTHAAFATRCSLPITGYRLPACYLLSAIRYRLSAIRYPLPAAILVWNHL